MNDHVGRKPDPDIACTYCDARYWERCHRANGRPTEYHRQRDGIRRCRCGGDLATLNDHECPACKTADEKPPHEDRRRVPYCSEGHALAKGSSGRYLACKVCALARRRAIYQAAKDVA